MIQDSESYDACIFFASRHFSCPFPKKSHGCTPNSCAAWLLATTHSCIYLRILTSKSGGFFVCVKMHGCFLGFFLKLCLSNGDFSLFDGDFYHVHDLKPQKTKTRHERIPYKKNGKVNVTMAHWSSYQNVFFDRVIHVIHVVFIHFIPPPKKKSSKSMRKPRHSQLSGQTT